MKTKKIYLYPIWIRIWHVINALCFLLLIITGISLHYATTGSSFIRFDIAVAMHNACAIIVTINYGYYILGNMFTRNGAYYLQWRKNLIANMWKQLRFYAFGIFKKEKHPFPVSVEQKFNPLQKFSYVMVMYFGMPLLVISGLGLMFPEYIAYNIFNISGLVFYDVLHIVVGFVLSIFLVIHIYTCTLGEKPGTLFKSMITGYHEEDHE